MQRYILSGTRFLFPGMKLELMSTRDPIIFLHKIRLSYFPAQNYLKRLVVHELANVLSNSLRRTGYAICSIGWKVLDDRIFITMDLMIA